MCGGKHIARKIDRARSISALQKSASCDSKDMNNATTKTQNFANAIKTVAASRKGLQSSGRKLVEMTTIRAAFPRTSQSEFDANVAAAIKAGHLRTLRDGDCLWVVA